jgi:hypothetical protein
MRYSSTGPCSPLFHRFTDRVHVGMFIILLLTISIPTVSVLYSFSDLAYSLEKRAWRVDREADTEAVTAFRHEAWMIAASLPSGPGRL